MANTTVELSTGFNQLLLQFLDWAINFVSVFNSFRKSDESYTPEQLEGCP